MGKQESLSVGYVQDLCALSGFLDGDDVKRGDKTPSYDGNRL